MMKIKDIAKLSGVSAGTVDRVIHNRYGVSRKNVDKIRKILKKYNYKPNIYARNLALQRDFNFAALFPETGVPNCHWDLVREGISKAEAELEHFNIKTHTLTFNRFSKGTFESIKRKIEKLNPDGLIYTPVILPMTEDFLLNFQQKKPVVYFYNNSLENTGHVSFILSDGYQAGQLAGKLISQLVKDKGEIAVFYELPDYSVNQRIRGFTDYLNAHRAELVPKVYTLFQKGDSFNKELSFKILSEKNKIRGIYMPNYLAYMVVEYMIKYKIGHLPLVGFDLIEKNIKHVKTGLINYIISFKAVEQGYEAVHRLFRQVVLKESHEAGTKMMALDIITKENLF